MRDNTYVETIAKVQGEGGSLCVWGDVPYSQKFLWDKISSSPTTYILVL